MYKILNASSMQEKNFQPRRQTLTSKAKMKIICPLVSNFHLEKNSFANHGTRYVFYLLWIVDQFRFSSKISSFWSLLWIYYLLTFILYSIPNLFAHTRISYIYVRCLYFRKGKEKKRINEYKDVLIAQKKSFFYSPLR